MQLLWWGFVLIISFLQITDIRMSDRELMRKLNVDDKPVHIRYYHYGNYNIRYADVGDPERPLIIFVHGAPGSLDAFTGFLNDPSLRRKFRMISVDRPGYGYSGHGRSLISIRKQAESLLPLLDLNENKSGPLLVGHSYGGPIVAEMAIFQQRKTGALLLVGAAMDPDHEKKFWINYMLKWAPLRWLMPGSVNVANDEKLTHSAELKKISQGWDSLTIPVTIIHGTSDSLVPVKNAYFAEKVLKNAPVTMRIYKNTGHLIPWLNPSYMKKELRRFPADEMNITSN